MTLSHHVRKTHRQNHLKLTQNTHLTMKIKLLKRLILICRKWVLDQNSQSSLIHNLQKYQIQKEMEKEQIDNAKFVGWLKVQRLIRYLAHANVMVQCVIFILIVWSIGFQRKWWEKRLIWQEWAKFLHIPGSNLNARYVSMPIHWHSNQK